MKRAAVVLVALALILWVEVVKSEPQPQTTVRLFDPDPFRAWVDRAETTMPEDVQVKIASCGGGACVNIATRIMSFPQRYLDSPAFSGARSTFYHEAGHLFQLENNDEVQAGYPALDPRCEGTFSGQCAEHFADRFKACAMGTKNRNPPTCAFIEEVAG